MNIEASTLLLKRIHQSCSFNIDALKLLNKQLGDLSLQQNLNEVLDEYLEIHEKVEADLAQLDITLGPANIERVLTLNNLSVESLTPNQVEELAKSIHDGAEKDLIAIRNAYHLYLDSREKHIDIPEGFIMLNANTSGLTNFFYPLNF